MGDEPDCVRAWNPCWTLLEPPANQLKPAAFVLSKAGTGCSNWRSSKIGRVLKLANHYQCGVQCEFHEGCKSFNFQPEDCDVGGGACSQQVGLGACYLFGGDCE